MKKKNKLSIEKKVLVSGIVTHEFSNSAYAVEAVFRHQKEGKETSYPIKVSCTVSGKMKKSMIMLRKGDEVDVEVSLYNPNVGVIVYRKNKKQNV